MTESATRLNKLRTNFGFLQSHDVQLVRLGMLAERYFAEDPNTAILKLRQLAELLAQLVASKVGLYSSSTEAQYDLLRRLQDQGILPREVATLFGEVRRAGNAASHAIVGDHRTALTTLKLTWQIAVWFHRTFSSPSFKAGAFLPPVPPKDESAELRAELLALKQKLEQHQAVDRSKSELLADTELQLRAAKDEQAFWEQMALEADQAKQALERKLAVEQQQGEAQSKSDVAAMVTAAATAAQSVELDEAETRKLVDAQLRAAGWTVDSAHLSHSRGTRPEKGKNFAIAEWPTANGPADYVLFVGLMPVAAVEAKRKNIDVSASLQQAKRYSRGFKNTRDQDSNGGPWDAFNLPFAFSTNGRPYLRQLATRSGTWFCDLRNPQNLSRVLDGWYTPEGIVALLKQDAGRAHQQLKHEPFNYGFPLRYYQQEAIQAVENGIESGQREMLLAMATGTGKTKTCIALIYRLAGLNVQCEERPPEQHERGLVKISAVTWGTYDDSESKTLPHGKQVPEHTRIKAGDLLLSRANTLELVGACVIVENTGRPVYLSDKVLRLIAPEDWKQWLLIVLQSPIGRKAIEARASGNQLSMRNLSQANLREIAIPKPPMEERDEIVRRVRSLFKLEDAISHRLGAAVGRVKSLTPSVLAKPFRGELVQQDPNDEPAEALLARVRASRASSSDPPRAKKRGRRRT